MGFDNPRFLHIFHSLLLSAPKEISFSAGKMAKPGAHSETGKPNVKDYSASCLRYSLDSYNFLRFNYWTKTQLGRFARFKVTLTKTRLL